MTRFRLLLTGENSAARNMAIDEAVMWCCPKPGIPTVRFYSWKPPAVSIGYFQQIEEEVDLEECKKQGVDVVRRITGGGAVFHEKELTYSFACGEESGLVSENILESYKKICNSIVLGLGALGLKAEFAPLNDIVVGGKKISGNAQTRRGGVVLQHGTIILGVDVGKMFLLLRVPNEKLKGKMIEDVKQRVTSAEQQLGRKVPFEEAAAAMKKGFEENFGVKLEEGELTAVEEGMAKMAEERRFAYSGWNYCRRTSPRGCILRDLPAE
ncbi:MAG: biotin/lipoate A/B protein ligase family protein [Candidatus Diapherotrites archaeon]|nr:biotin/lipoate A/B protein ligase family protein [Candidatus Diapherotrites archaeon]